MRGGAAAAVAVIGMVVTSWAVAQEEGFVGRPGQVGSFESFDPVLTDDVMTGMIPSGQNWFLFGEGDRGGISGWLNGGFVGNFGVPPSKFNGPYNAVDRANEAMMNQVYFIAERTLPTDGSTGIGYRTDLPLELLITAFQRHWRQECVDGRLDAGTLARLNAVALIAD